VLVHGNAIVKKNETVWGILPVDPLKLREQVRRMLSPGAEMGTMDEGRSVIGLPSL
jgi:hypothetical protein